MINQNQNCIEIENGNESASTRKRVILNNKFFNLFPEILN